MICLKGISLDEVHPGIWRINPVKKMRVGVHLVGNAELFHAIESDKSVEQAMNVATLPGVIDPVLAMPDMHQGYGFPIGGVAAFHEKTGVVSPGGVGYDINCGVRLLTTNLSRDEIHHKDTMRGLVNDLFAAIPCGVGSHRNDISFTDDEFEQILLEGAPYAIRKGFGVEEDCEHIEERGVLRGADASAVSHRAHERGRNQLGTLGSGNHFVEIQYVDQIHHEKAASAFGLENNQVVVTIHTGSRGLGYQVCSDYLEASLTAAKKYGIELADRELAAAPLDSPEAQNYFKAMNAAANFAFANRQIITHWVRQVFQKTFPHVRIPLLYDVCHNIAKYEEMPIGKRSRRLCIHRKGATRAYPPGHPLVSPAYRCVGQPVLVPGDMGRCSFVLVGNPGSLELTFGSACHGAGRELSRTQAKKLGKGRPLIRELEEKGIYVKTAGRNTAIEEMPEAYKDVSQVVAATETAQIASIVAKLRPIGVIKG